MPKPRNVRNFWIEAEYDGPHGVVKIAGGPTAKTGAFRLTVYQRDEGGITTVLTMEGFAQGEGGRPILSDRDPIVLVLNVHDENGECVLQSITRRDPEAQ